MELYKYKKYKEKYLNTKNMIGGDSKEPELFNKLELISFFTIDTETDGLIASSFGFNVTNYKSLEGTTTYSITEPESHEHIKYPIMLVINYQVMRHSIKFNNNGISVDDYAYNNPYNLVYIFGECIKKILLNMTQFTFENKNIIIFTIFTILKNMKTSYSNFVVAPHVQLDPNEADAQSKPVIDESMIKENCNLAKIYIDKLLELLNNRSSLCITINTEEINNISSENFTL